MTSVTIDDPADDWGQSDNNQTDWSQQSESQTDWSQQTETQADWGSSSGNQNDCKSSNIFCQRMCNQPYVKILAWIVVTFIFASF